jgi:hypothetical protein
MAMTAWPTSSATPTDSSSRYRLVLANDRRSRLSYTSELMVSVVCGWWT